MSNQLLELADAEKRKRLAAMDAGAGDQLPASRPTPIASKMAAAARAARAQQPKRTAAQIRGARRAKLMESVMDKINRSVMFGGGAPAGGWEGSGVIPAEQLRQQGLDLPGAINGQPVSGLDVNKFSSMLTPREKRFLQKVLKRNAMRQRQQQQAPQ